MKSYKQFIKEYSMGLQVPSTSYLKGVGSLNKLTKKEMSSMNTAGGDETPAPILSLKKKSRSSLNDLKEIIDRVGGFDYAHEKISEFNNQAVEALSPYPDSPYKKSMIDLISFNAQRKG